MIEIKQLSKAFDDHVVLDRLDLSIEAGKTVVIIGRSGEGKSVLLKHIIGLIRPDAGQVLIDGVEIHRLSGRALDQLRMKFGMLFQGAALFDSMTVEENVGFPLVEHSARSSEAIRQRVEECLGLVGLRDVEDLYPAELSGGMRKRVGLARAIAMGPEIILYDEPTTGIDPIMSDAINNLIIALRDRFKVTSVVVTHDIKSAYKVADQIAMLYNGTIIETGSPEAIRGSRNPIVQQFIKGEAEGPIPSGVIAGHKRVFSRWQPMSGS